MYGSGAAAQAAALLWTIQNVIIGARARNRGNRVRILQGGLRDTRCTLLSGSSSNQCSSAHRDAGVAAQKDAPHWTERHRQQCKNQRAPGKHTQIEVRDRSPNAERPHQNEKQPTT